MRDTVIDKDNPFTTTERVVQIHKAMYEWRDQYTIISIPDISEVCYGRDVGYKIRQIELSTDLEDISGTQIRKAREIRL